MGSFRKGRVSGLFIISSGSWSFCRLLWGAGLTWRLGSFWPWRRCHWLRVMSAWLLGWRLPSWGVATAAHGSDLWQGVKGHGR